MRKAETYRGAGSHKDRMTARKEKRASLMMMRGYRPAWASRSKYSPHQGKRECARRAERA